MKVVLKSKVKGVDDQICVEVEYISIEIPKEITLGFNNELKEKKTFNTDDFRIYFIMEEKIIEYI